MNFKQWYKSFIKGASKATAILRTNKQAIRCQKTALLLLITLAGFAPGSPYFTSPGDIGDDTDYWSHAMTIALDFDLDYSNEPAECLNYQNGPRCYPVGSIGPGLLASPFVALFSLADRLTGHPILRDHSHFLHSWALLGFYLAATCYFALAVLLYFDIANSFVPLSPMISYIFATGSGILFYVLHRFSMGHVYEFFCAALVLWCSLALWRTRKNVWLLQGYAFLGALGCVLSLMIRPANVNIVLLPCISFLFLALSEGRSPSFLLRHGGKRLSAMAGCGILCSLPYFALNMYLYNEPIRTPATYGGFSMAPDVTTGNLFQEVAASCLLFFKNTTAIFFSSEFGLLYSNPLVVAGFAMLVMFLYSLFRKKANLHLVIIASTLYIVYMAIPLYIVAVVIKKSGASYGYRALFSLFPEAFLVYFVSLFYIQKSHAALSKSIISATTIICLFSILSQTMYNTFESLASQINAFGIWHESSGNGYYFKMFRAFFEIQTWKMIYYKKIPPAHYFTSPSEVTTFLLMCSVYVGAWIAFLWSYTGLSSKPPSPDAASLQWSDRPLGDHKTTDS